MIFNKNELLDKVGNMEDLFREMLEIFIEDTPGNIVDINDAINSKDANKIYELCHGLKGSSMTICSDNLTNICIIIEQKGRENQLDGIEKLQEQLNIIFNELLIELRKHLE